MINDKYMEFVPEANKKGYLQYISKFDTLDPWGSHQPALIHLLNTVDKGDVFEFGVGNNSTHIINTICRKQGRKIVSIEYDAKWFTLFESLRNEQDHEILLYEIDKLLTKKYDFFNRHFSIAFIDGSPARMRMPLIKLMKNQVDYFIIHDTEEIAQGVCWPGWSYNYDFSGFEFVTHFKYGKSPTTSIISNVSKIKL